MSEKRVKETTILLRNQGKTIKLELFPAAAWGGPAGSYRLRLDGCWHSPGCDKYAYFTPSGVAGLLVAHLGGEPAETDVRPELCRGDRVRVPCADGGYLKTFVAGAPVLGIDGRWWVWAGGCEDPVAVDTLLSGDRGAL
ncbi:hypothetical protein DFW101_0338 [Solidesulfovibrio carbinoliphilus subsp. oakridgensis]|uniref:Uncharacterized protein n=1 Tax=Solidesulfovibrio carbinoliphilus subsp. oakridgensis TaxID=694327 RepID=G7QD49_9BACT|nr:hypothetical protein [Solidesulfovibrio carbinoliphilus]EHJ46355.1 hypothetical protein DFW101_0338 [Solidesulfovibrio carbinoliphilus subsp. oakridgensis]